MKKPNKNKPGDAWTKPIKQIMQEAEDAAMKRAQKLYRGSKYEADVNELAKTQMQACGPHGCAYDENGYCVYCGNLRPDWPEKDEQQ